MKSIVIGQASDGFYLTFYENEQEIKSYRFDQEDTVEQLVEVFNAIGIEAKFEEIY